LIFKKIQTKIVELSNDKKGTHTIQCILDFMTMEEEEILLVKAIENHIYELSIVNLFSYKKYIGSAGNSYNRKNSSGLWVKQKGFYNRRDLRQAH